MNVSEKTESLRADTLSFVDFSMSLAMKMRDSQKISQKNESPFQGNSLFCTTDQRCLHLLDIINAT